MATSSQNSCTAETVVTSTRRVVFFGADDDVVKQVDPHQLPGIANLTGNHEVSTAGCRITAWVIVDADDGASARQHRRAEYFPRMRQRTGRRTNRDPGATERPVLSVEAHHIETFLQRRVVKGTVHVFNNL